MTLDRFWDIIRAAKENSRDDLDTMYESLFCALEKLELQELMEWAQILELYYNCSRGTKLRAAVIEACGDDDTDHLCGWLLAQGREFYHQVMQAPSCLCEVIENNDTQFGEILNIVPNVYLKKIHVKEWMPEYYLDAKAKHPLPAQIRDEIITEVETYTYSTPQKLGVSQICRRYDWKHSIVENL